MKSRMQVYLNGKGLHEIDEKIVVLDVTYAAPRSNVSSQSNGYRDGSYVSSIRFDDAQLTVSVEIHEYNMARRQRLLQLIAAWALPGGWLTVSDRPGQRIYVRCSDPPTIGSAFRWTERVDITLGAFEFPYWQDDEPKTATLTGTGAEGSMLVPGIASPCYFEAEVTPTGTLTSLTLGVGDSYIQLSGISVTDPVVISYDERHILSIVSGAVSLLDKRTASSSDDLTADAGTQAALTLTANVSCTAIFKAKGGYV